MDAIYPNPRRPIDATHFRGARELFSAYRELSKSGIVALVLISVLGGYLIGHPADLPFSPSHLLMTLLGVLFLASGSSALNQFQERTVDANMPRTAKRPIPSGRMSAGHALAFSLGGITLGAILLARLSTELLALGAAAVLLYNVLYTLWWKRRWAFAAVPGAVPGALPILMGYVAASGTLWAAGGWYLFFILFFWQMPHFWVLALRFRGDYAQGGFPTLPVSRGTEVTVFQIGLWCLAYVGLALLAPLFLNVGAFYLSVAIAMGIKLLVELVRFARQPESQRWWGFFLWVNFSLIILIGAAALDGWRYQLLAPFWIRG